MYICTTMILASKHNDSLSLLRDICSKNMSNSLVYRIHRIISKEECKISTLNLTGVSRGLWNVHVYNTSALKSFYFSPNYVIYDVKTTYDGIFLKVAIYNNIPNQLIRSSKVATILKEMC
jgi:hypothetical protein